MYQIKCIACNVVVLNCDAPDCPTSKKSHSPIFPGLVMHLIQFTANLYLFVEDCCELCDFNSAMSMYHQCLVFHKVTTYLSGIAKQDCSLLAGKDLGKVVPRTDFNISNRGNLAEKIKIHCKSAKLP